LGSGKGIVIRKEKTRKRRRAKLGGNGGWGRDGNFLSFKLC